MRRRRRFDYADRIGKRADRGLYDRDVEWRYAGYDGVVPRQYPDIGSKCHGGGEHFRYGDANAEPNSIAHPDADSNAYTVADGKSNIKP